MFIMYKCSFMKVIKLNVAFAFSICFGLFILSACEINTARNPSVENGRIKLEFDRETGALVAFRDLTNGKDFLYDTIRHISSWEIDLLQAALPDTISTGSALQFRYSNKDALKLVMEWAQFKGSTNTNLKVTVRIALEKDKPFSSWQISVEGIKGKQIKRIVFPRITGIKNSEDQFLAVPVWTGRLIKNPAAELLKNPAKEKKYEWGYPGLMSLQCMALYSSDQSGFYASCNDSLAYSKDFSFALDSHNHLAYQLSNYPSLDTALDKYEPAYESVIGTFIGDWTTAALIYRDWGTKQKWCRESRLKKGLTPDWLEKTALWEWNRGKSVNVLDPAYDLKKRLGLPVNVFWHWWHGCSYDDGFPEYIPPREGKYSFITAMTSARNNGIRAIVYMNQALWGTTTKSWEKENAVLASAKDAGGNTISHVFNKFTNKPAAYMCMGTQFWKDKYSSLCDSVVNRYKVNGVYMDMACLSLKCYDKSHGHQIGGGNYWIENFSRITNQIRSSIDQGKELVLAGEGCGEVWLPYLDAFLTLEMSKERYAGIGGWETIPFFQAVYHQYSITYGNYSSLTEPPYDELWPKEYAPKVPLKLLDRKFNKQFLMEQARSFVWGIQPTIANYKPSLVTERKEEIQYLLDMAKIRNQGLQYLLYGKFLQSPDFSNPKEEFDISRLSIYAGKTGNTVTAFRAAFPMIYSGMWKSDSGLIGIAFASISDNPLRVDFNIKASDYEILPSGKIYMIDATGRKLMCSYSDRKIHIDFTLQKRGLCLLEIIPEM